MAIADVVETERLLLRPWREDDGAELAKSSLRQWRVNGFGPWAALDKATGSWIGRVGLDELDDWPETDRIEVGFELHRARWGRGLATEAARAALAFGFEQHDLERIISVTAAAHTAARRVMEKAGLTYQGTGHWLIPEVPVVWYAIDRSTWRGRKRDD